MNKINEGQEFNRIQTNNLKRVIIDSMFDGDDDERIAIHDINGLSKIHHIKSLCTVFMI